MEAGVIDPTDRAHTPSLAELEAYVHAPLFALLHAHMTETYKALVSVEYSGDQQLPGWNVRFRKGGRTLLRLYPHPGYVTVLAVIGRREKARAEALLQSLSPATQAVYAAAKEGMGQRWLLLDLREADARYADVLALVQLRRERP